MTHLKEFVDLTDEKYPHCTLREKLEVFVQHRPAAICGFLEEIVTLVRRQAAEIENLKRHISEVEEQETEKND
jgi:hypothetical protein